MISSELIVLLFIILFVLVSFNLLLSFLLFNGLRKLNPNTDSAQPLPDGEVIPTFEALDLTTQKPFEYEQIRQEAKVFLFLSSLCPKCKSKLPEIQQLVERSQDQGVSIWLLSDEKPPKLKRFLKGTELFSRTLGLTSNALALLNPVSASPFYLFVDQQEVLQTSGLIGDDNWSQFRQQLLEVEQELSAEQ